MGEHFQLPLIIIGFLIIAVAAGRIAVYFPKIKLPIITGLLVIGIFSGPFVLKLIPKESISNLNFINEISLAFIAFAAGAELYLKELSDRFKSIKWMTFGQLAFTFVLGGLSVWFLADSIPFLKNMNGEVKLAVSLLTGTIFVARSPVSAIAVINEMRAKGPFTQTAMGVTVLADVLVIILFTICFAVSDNLIQKISFNIWLVVILIFELVLSLFIGYLLGMVLKKILSLNMTTFFKSVFILAVGYSVYLLSHQVHYFSKKYFGFDIYIEPLLICIVGSFIVVNYSRFRREFLKIIEEAVPLVYVVFFTLTGASISLDILMYSWGVALLFFVFRLVGMTVGAYVGGTIAGDPASFKNIAWMPYITQAGVALGLVSVVANKYPLWGEEFATIMIAVIVLNQIVGPPLFKWAILHARESHLRGDTKVSSGIERAIIFGLEGQSLALARQLIEHSWEVKILTRNEQKALREYNEIDVEYIKDLSLDELKRMEADKADAIVLMNKDEDNLIVCELAYEHFGTRDLVVRLHERGYFRKFHELGALIVEPTTAIVGLLDHLVRSPIATSLILGMDKDQDTVDVSMQNSNLHGIALRDLHLPPDIIILATKRNRNTLISTGYTRLRLGDVLTIVGPVESIEKVRLRFESMSKNTSRKRTKTPFTKINGFKRWRKNI